MSDDRPLSRSDAKAFVTDIRLEHSLFALPFALLGMLLAARADCDAGARSVPWPTWAELGWILVAMVGTRSAAMGFNRVVDRHLDRHNPRTMHRPLAAGQASLRSYQLGVGLGVLMLLTAAWQLNPLCLTLTPLVLLIVFGYSYTKRLTRYCHYFIGLALAIAPLGAWVAITGAIPNLPGPYLLALAVLCWVGGFDILYATMDLDFDRERGIHSLPAELGVEPALRLAQLSHFVMILALSGLGYCGPGLGTAWWVGVLVTAAILAYEHAIVRPDDLRRVNTAFFTLNGVIGLLLLAMGLVDLVQRA